MANNVLSADQVAIALARIAAWRTAPDNPVACPVCEQPVLSIIDQSTRPHVEWYALSCPACGLETTIQVPLAPRMPGGD
ncbi:MAG: hypothetical protein ACR2OF_01400 [Hyphomicrobium sp.]